MSYLIENFTFFFGFNSKIFLYHDTQISSNNKKKDLIRSLHNFVKKIWYIREKILSRCCNTYYWSYDTTSTVLVVVVCERFKRAIFFFFLNKKDIY